MKLYFELFKKLALILRPIRLIINFTLFFMFNSKKVFMFILFKKYRSKVEPLLDRNTLTIRLFKL